MRTIGAGLAAKLASGDVCLAKCVRLTPRDGIIFNLTSLDEAIEVDLGAGAESYAQGMRLSAIESGDGLDAASCELSGPIDDVITAAAILGGRFDLASVRMFVATPEASGIGAIFGGYVAQADVRGDRYVFELRDHRDRLNQVVGRLITPYCDADFCDARCGLDLADFTTAATVNTVADAMRFNVTYTGSIADDLLNSGTILFTSGAFDGIAPIEIFDWAVGGDLQLFEPLPAIPEIGDTLDLRLGCAKTRAACMAFDNILNFRGFPEVPGSDQALKYPNPGSGGG